MSEVALLLIDMQLGNFASNPVHKATDLLARTRSLIQKARVSKVPIIYVQNNGGKGDPDEHGTEGWKIHPSVVPMKDDTLVQKETPDAFHRTNLREMLESRSVRKLIVAGLQTEYCVDTTCRRAFSLGYDVILVKDTHSTWDTPILTAEQVIQHHNSVLEGFFVTLKNEEELVF